jgi:hypothetical protein
LTRIISQWSLTMDHGLQLLEKSLEVLVSRRQTRWALGGSTALLALAVIAYCRTHRQHLISTADLPKTSQDRFMRLQDSSQAENNDPPLLQKHSTFNSYATSYAAYSSVRTFYHPHPQASKFPRALRRSRSSSFYMVWEVHWLSLHPC